MAEDISIKGLDTFSKNFLLGDAGTNKSDPEYVTVAAGQQIKPEAVKRYQEERLREFIRRAGSFTEDLVAFVIEQKGLRSLSDAETVFGLALANINLRNDYGRADAKEAKDRKSLDEIRESRLAEFDTICVSAQEFYDANT